MKILAFIMAFLVLALSFLPCADSDAASNYGNAKSEITKSNTQNGGTQQDHCSPFCHCTCCAGFSINHFIASIEAIKPYKEATMMAHLPCEIIKVSLPIWQPPQLV